MSAPGEMAVAEPFWMLWSPDETTCDLYTPDGRLLARVFQPAFVGLLKDAPVTAEGVPEELFLATTLQAEVVRLVREVKRLEAVVASLMPGDAGHYP